MKFITGIQESIVYGKIYKTIFMAINKLSKMCHYIFYHSNITAKELAEIIT